VCAPFTCFVTCVAKVELVRYKDRVRAPTEGGWSDGMANIRFLSDPNAHVCEVQLVLRRMMLVRKQMNAHHGYVTQAPSSHWLASPPALFH
jgi:hypothetical protein